MTASRGTSNHLTVQKALNKKILAVFQRLPENQQKVANYILQQPNELAFVTSDTLARRLKISKPTIVRFARSLGYKGFTDLQQECIGALHSDLSNVPRFLGDLKKQTQNEALATRRGERSSRTSTTRWRISTVRSSTMLWRCCSGRRQVFTMGTRHLRPPLPDPGLRTGPGGDPRAVPSPPARCASWKSLALASERGCRRRVLLPPLFPRDHRRGGICAEAGGAVSSRSRTPVTSPITFHAEQVIVVRTKNMLYTNSISAVSIMMNAIVTELALKNKKAITPDHGSRVQGDARDRTNTHDDLS